MAQSTANRVYENHEPPHDWAHDEGSDTLILMLPGFRRDQLKVKITSNRILKINGERQIGENRWRRFSEEFPLPSDVDTNALSAKFAGGLLYVKLPKTNKPQEEPKRPQEEPKRPPKAEIPPTPKPHDQQEAPQEASPPKPKEEKAEAKSDETSQKIAQKDQNDAKEKSKMEADAATKEALKKEKSPNDQLGDREAKAKTSEAQEKHETVGGLDQGEAKIDRKSRSSPTSVLRLSSTQQFKEALVGLIVVVKRQSKLTNLIVAILLVLVLGLYVKNAVKSYSGGARNREL